MSAGKVLGVTGIVVLGIFVVHEYNMNTDSEYAAAHWKKVALQEAKKNEAEKKTIRSYDRLPESVESNLLTIIRAKGYSCSTITESMKLSYNNSFSVACDNHLNVFSVKLNAGKPSVELL